MTDLLLADIVTTRALNPQEARGLVDSIKTDVADIGKRIEVAYVGQSWLALGYPTWDEMCEAEFAGARLRIPREDRAEQVQSLRAAGLSTRAIGAAIGVDEKTVRNDLAGAEKSAPAVVGKDGKKYAPTQPPRTSPPPVVPSSEPVAPASDSPQTAGGELTEAQWCEQEFPGTQEPPAPPLSEAEKRRREDAASRTAYSVNVARAVQYLAHMRLDEGGPASHLHKYDPALASGYALVTDAAIREAASYLLALADCWEIAA